MSQETMKWLNDNVLAGMSDTRPVWWAKYAMAEGHAPNLFPGPVPFERVYELIASWMPVPAGLYDVDTNAVETLFDADMNPVQAFRITAISTVTTHKLIKAADTGERMSVVGWEYAIHSYRDWLTGTVQEVLGDEAVITSAGLLRNRAQAWVQIQRPEVASGPGGVKFAPNVLLSTSLDYSLPSNQNMNWTHTICDNTMRIARTEGLAASIKHTKHSGNSLGDYRSIFNRLIQGENDFSAELERQLSVKVDDNQFDRFLASFVPVSDDDSPAKKTKVARKRQEITDLYRNDPRVAAWTGTMFGVVQAANTWEEHSSQLRNATGIADLSDTELRAMRNYGRMIKPVKGDSDDMITAKVLASVL